MKNKPNSRTNCTRRATGKASADTIVDGEGSGGVNETTDGAKEALSNDSNGLPTKVEEKACGCTTRSKIANKSRRAIRGGREEASKFFLHTFVGMVLGLLLLHQLS